MTKIKLLTDMTKKGMDLGKPGDIVNVDKNGAVTDIPLSGKSVRDEKGFAEYVNSDVAQDMEKFTEEEAKKERTTKEILETELTPAEIKDSKKQLENPDLLLNKDHVGDDKPKLFLFCNCLSSRLPPENRFSSALTGDTSEGKTNLWKTISRHLPNEWFIDLTRITASSLEDDIPKDCNLIYFGEEGANKSIIEQVKQIVEDGIDVLKKDTRDQYKSVRREQQPRKVGIYSSTKNPQDEELSTRYAVISVHGHSKKYKCVNIDTLNTVSDLIKQIEKKERKEKPTWIEQALRLLKHYDFIVIPYAPLFNVESKKGRSQRDLKRFLCLIKTLTWLHQYKRLNYEYNGYRILVANPEDFYNAMEIGKEIFDQSLSGLEPRLEEVIKSYIKLKELAKKDIDPDAEEGMEWVDRSLIQKDLDISRRETIKNRINELADQNIMTYFNKGNRCYVALKFYDSPTNLPTNYPLITDGQKLLYDHIKQNYRLILESTLVGQPSVNSSLNEWVSSCLTLKNDLPTNMTEKALFSRLKNELNAKKDKISQSEPSVDKKEFKSQEEKVKEFIDYCQKIKKEGHKITYVNLCHQFGKPFIEKMKEQKEIIALPGGNYDLPS